MQQPAVLSPELAERVFGNSKNWWTICSLAYLFVAVLTTILQLTSQAKFVIIFPSLMWLLAFIAGGVAIELMERRVKSNVVVEKGKVS